jgi:hypothetical protein
MPFGAPVSPEELTSNFQLREAQSLSGRKTSYALAAAKSGAITSSSRVTQDVGDCYYLVTISTDLNTGVSTIVGVDFLGCDDGGGGGGSGGSGNVGGGSSGGTVANYTDKPTSGQKCGNNPGSPYGYQDNLPASNSGQIPFVTNISEVYSPNSSLPTSINDGLSVGTTLIGWYYQDNNNNIWFQPNPNNGTYPQISVGINAGVLAFSVNFTTIPQTTPQLLTYPNGATNSTVTTLPPLPSNQILGTCWQSLGTVPVSNTPITMLSTG